jgi:hypothetical protein
VDDQTEIASSFTVGKYRQIRLNLDASAPCTEDWQAVFGAFKRRIRERFLRPIRELAKHDKKCLKAGIKLVDGRGLPYAPGASILALDCLLIDTIQSFREGRGLTATISPARSFKEFLRSSNGFSDFTSRDREDFFGDVRNGLLHNGETRGNWKFRIDVPRLLIKDQQSRTINRRIFHARIVREFRQFCWSLTSVGDSAIEAKDHFLRRMDAICGV